MSPTTHTLFQCNPREEISHFHPGEGGGEVNKFTERLRSEVQPVTLFAYYFSRKRSPFVYPLLINITLSHTLFRTLHPFLLL